MPHCLKTLAVDIRNSFEIIEYYPENQNAWNDAYLKFLKLLDLRIPN